MNIDINQFIETFLEESFEGLEVMESQLLTLEDDDTEAINTIFRAIHSIKGGAGTFGFRDVAEFTHGVETLLDQVRSHKRYVTSELVKLLLSANDCIRDLLLASRDGITINADRIDAIQSEIEALLAQKTGETKAETIAVEAKTPTATQQESDTQTASAPDHTAASGWHIHFVPEHGILRTGNDPLRIFGVLADLGTLTAECHLEHLPPLEALEPEECLLAWTLTLRTHASESQVRELFEWVEDECELEITPLASKPIDSAGVPDAQGLARDPAPHTDIDTAIAAVETTSTKVHATTTKDIQASVAEHDAADASVLADTATTAQTETAATTAQTETAATTAQTETAVTTAQTETAVTTAQTETAVTTAQTETAHATQASKATSEEILAPHPSKQPAEIKEIKRDKAKADTSQARSTERRSESGSIRVNTDKIDALINLVGELVITQSMLSQIGERMENQDTEQNLEKLFEGLAQLERNTRELQENVMSIRMLPISFAFNRFPRMVHDLSAQLGKQVELKLSGEQTELDKTVMEKIGDPLVHLVRNAVDHGIEPPEARTAQGKSPTGTVHLNAYHKGGNIIIEISDDGWGLNRDRILQKALEKGVVSPDQHLTDEQIFDLVFAPGFSTADQVSDVSGRGVGMDVVRRNIKALGGGVEVRTSPGHGSTFSIRLPLTLAILDGQLLHVGGETYIVPLISIVESLQIRRDFVKSVAEHNLMYRLRDEYIPILFLNELLGVPGTRTKLHEALLVVVETEGQKAALVVDDLLGQQQVVIKALETNYRRVEGLSGATILGDGSVALILDVSGLIVLGRQHSERRQTLNNSIENASAA